MSEEEKEAVEMLNSYINAIDTFGTIDTKCYNNLYKPTKTVLNYIDKLQKEVKEKDTELSHIAKLFNENTNRLETISRKLGLTKKNEIGFIYDEIVKEVDKLQKENEYLQERLEFRVRYCNELEHELYEEGNYIHKEVIRKKIKELEVKYKKYEKEGLSGFVEKLDIGTRIGVLKKLLGE